MRAIYTTKNMEDIKVAKQVIEINGSKFEVDLSTARKIDEYRIGDNIKVLRNRHGSFDVMAGVIIQFVEFRSLPTIQIAVFKQDYFGSNIEFINYNAETEDIEISACSPHELYLEKSSVMEKFEMEIAAKQATVDDLRRKRDWFVKYFEQYFTNCEDAKV